MAEVLSKRKRMQKTCRVSSSTCEAPQLSHHLHAGRDGTGSLTREVACRRWHTARPGGLGPGKQARPAPGAPPARPPGHWGTHTPGVAQALQGQPLAVSNQEPGSKGARIHHISRKHLPKQDCITHGIHANGAKKTANKISPINPDFFIPSHLQQPACNQHHARVTAV